MNYATFIPNRFWVYPNLSHPAFKMYWLYPLMTSCTILLLLDSLWDHKKMEVDFIIRPPNSSLILNLVTRRSLKSNYNLFTLLLCPFAVITLTRRSFSFHTMISRLLTQIYRCFTHVIQSFLLIPFPSEL